MPLKNRESRGTRVSDTLLLINVDSIGIDVAMHGYIDVQYADKATCIDNVDEDKAVIDLAALLASRFPAAVVLPPENASSLALGLKWDIKRCLIRAVFG